MKTLFIALVLVALAFPAAARTKLVDGVRVPLTVAEEAQRDVEEAAWANSVTNKAAIDAQRNRDRAVQRMNQDPLIKAMIARQAAAEGKTIRQITDELKAFLP